MMEAVDLQRRLARRPGQLRDRIDRDAVRQVRPPEGSLVVFIDVLEERAAEGDVDHLLAAADAEHGQPAGAGLPEKLDLGPVQLGVDRPHRGVRLLAVEGRIDIPPAG